MAIYIVRHGERGQNTKPNKEILTIPEFNAGINSRTDASLNQVGISQTGKLAQRIANSFT